MSTRLKCAILLLLCVLMTSGAYYWSTKYTNPQHGTSGYVKDLMPQDYDMDFDVEDNRGKVVEASIGAIYYYAIDISPTDDICYQGCVKDKYDEQEGYFPRYYIVISDSDTDSSNEILVRIDDDLYDELEVGDYVHGVGTVEYSYDLENHYTDVWVTSSSYRAKKGKDDQYPSKYGYKSVKELQEMIGQPVNQPVFKTTGILLLVGAEYRLYPDLDSFKQSPTVYVTVQGNRYSGSDDSLYSLLGQEITVQGIMGRDYGIYMYKGFLVE